MKKLLIALAVLALVLASSCALADTVLRPGDTGSAVLQMQKALVSLGYSTNGVDGKYGAGTLSAVRAFQAKYGLTVDGKAGPNTLNKLYSLTGGNPTPVPTASPSGNITGRTDIKLVYGDRGDQVLIMQRALNSLGFTTNGTDGKFGPGTLAAVKAFQTRYILDVDGKAGPKTLAKLYSLTGGNPTPAPATATPAPTAIPTVSPSGITGRTDIKLVYGNRGDQVLIMQRALNSLGFTTNGTDGKFGPGTLAAVRAFQTRYGLDVDGRAGPKTLAKLYSLTGGNPTPAPGYTVLRSGATGPDVTRLQTAMAALDYGVSVTGVYDDQTISWVRIFQSVNTLSVDGVAGKDTQGCLYSGSAKKFVKYSGKGVVVPDVGEIKLLHWFNEVKPLLSNGDLLTVYDPETTISFQLQLLSPGRHADCEPLTAEDTASLREIYGGVTTWDPKFVFVLLPNGVWSGATLHDTPHETNTIKDNNFDGHMCVHFLRDMSEVSVNDPKYGVTHQNALRAAWLKLTGESVP